MKEEEEKMGEGVSHESIKQNDQNQNQPLTSDRNALSEIHDDIVENASVIEEECKGPFQGKNIDISGQSSSE